MIAAVAIVLAEELHVSTAPAIGAAAASSAAPVSATVAPTSTVAVAGVTVTEATTAGTTGLVVPSLQVPKLLGAAVLQVPSAFRFMLEPSGVVPGSVMPMSVDVIPVAGPLSAVKAPPYEMNSTTVPVLFTSAMPSGLPFWMPFAGYVSNTTPRAPQLVVIVDVSARVPYESEFAPLQSTMLQPARLVPPGQEISIASPASVLALS